MSMPRTLTKLMLLAVAAQALSGCASLSPDDPPVCDGRHRRPANPYGSMLTPASPPAPDIAIQPQISAGPEIEAPEASDAVTQSDEGGCA